MKFLEKSRTGIAVGTPLRLYDLVEKCASPPLSLSLPLLHLTTNPKHISNPSIAALKLDKLERIVVDASHIDQKKRGLMDMKDTMIPLARWLARPEFKVRYADPENGLQLMFYWTPTYLPSHSIGMDLLAY